jgi:hypothetical protein
MAGALDAQVTARSVRGLPAESRTLSRKASASPMTRRAESGVRTTDATDGGLVVSNTNGPSQAVRAMAAVVTARRNV